MIGLDYDGSDDRAIIGAPPGEGLDLHVFDHPDLSVGDIPSRCRTARSTTSA